MVKFIVAREKPNLLVASGDLANQPVPWQMKRAARFVRDVYRLCSEEARLMVISGNHDYKFWGNIGLRRLTRIPFEIYFRMGGITHGFIWRLFRYFGLTLHALWPWSNRLRDPLQLVTLPDLGVTLVGFNSNTLTEMMAAGRVEPEDLQDLYEMFDGCARDPAFGFRYKIAVVHHHPAPIADVDTKLASRIQESFMVFYNAGLFLREINRRGFNLVVHGHKHFAGFLRVASEFGEHHRAEVPVAAAGSACHNHPDDPRGHHLQVIRLYDDDTAILESVFFSGSVESTEASRSYVLDSPKDVQRRRFNAFRDLGGFTIREIRKTSVITNDGYTDVQIEFYRLRVYSAAGLDCHPIDYQASEPTYLRDFAKVDLPNSPRFLKLVTKVSTLRAFSGNIEFGRRYTSQDAPFDFGLKYRLISGHTLTPREFQRHYAGKAQAWEDASLFCYLAAEILTLQVDFPAGYQLDSQHVEACAEYIPAPLKGVRDEDFAWDQLRPHEDESARVRDGLQILPGTLRLTVHNPIPGFLYKIKWIPKEQSGSYAEPPGARVTLQSEARVARVQGELLEIARGAADRDPAVLDRYECIVAPLRALADDFIKICNLPNETVDVAAMVFSNEDAKLYTVCATYGQIPQLFAATFSAGEGCAGFVFEKVRPLLYHPARDDIGYFIRPGERAENESGLLQPSVMLCFPWIEAGIVVGVINISTMKPDTDLLRLFDLNAEADKENQLMQGLAGMAAHNLFTMVAEGNYASHVAPG